MRIAYLVNQYPKISHTFIRREIAALEKQGLLIQRFSLRGMRGAVIDPADLAETDRTAVILDQPAGVMARAVLRRLGRPRFWKAARLAVAMGSRSTRGIRAHLAYLVEACVLCDLARSCRHVHAHFGTNAATVARLAQRLGGPSYSLTIHGPEEFEHVGSLALPAKVCEALFTVVDCAFSRAQVLRWLPPDRWQDVHVVRSMMSETARDEPPRSPPGQRRVVCIARLEPEKGVAMLIDAVQRLPPERRPGSVVIVGDGTLRSSLTERTAAAGLSGCVQFAGWADEAAVRRHILDADVVVLPSLAENLPVTLIDAFALRRPVIATMLAGIPELVQPGVNGWLVPAGDGEALADAIADAMTSPVTRLAAMGCAGRERALQMHDSQTQSAGLAGLFRRYVSSGHHA